MVLGSVSDRDAPYRPLTRPAMNNGARESGVVEKAECLAYLKAAFPFQNLRNFQILWFAFSQTNNISGRKPKPNTSNILASTFARVQCGQVLHYNDVIVGAIGSQITSLTIVSSTVYSDGDQRKHQDPRHWPLCGEFTGDRWIPYTNVQ